MASKFIIFLVFAAVAQSSSAETDDEPRTSLSKISKAGNATLANFYAVVDGYWEAIYDKHFYGGTKVDIIKNNTIVAFELAFDNTAAGMMPIAKNPAVFEQVEGDTKAAIRKLVETVWTLFEVTPASENLPATLKEIDDIGTDISYQVGELWNGIFEMCKNSVSSEVAEINMAIGELHPKAAALALNTGEAVVAAFKIWATKLAFRPQEEAATHLEALQILRSLARASMSAEVNEKFVLFQCIAAYYHVSDVSILNNFTRLMNDEIVIGAGLWEAFGGALWFYDEENDSIPSYETLNETIYNGMQAAYYSTLDAFQTIPSHVDVEVKPDHRIPKLADRITEGVRLTGGEITTEVSSQIEVVKQEVLTLAHDIWLDLYVQLIGVTDDIRGANPAIRSAWTSAAAGMETAINYLFRALKERLSKDFPAEEGIKYSLGVEISTKLCIVRGCYLNAELLNHDIEVPFTILYNDQLGSPPKQEE